MKKTILFYVALPLCTFTLFLMSNGYAHAAGNPDMGLPMYPGANVNPAFPPTNAPHLKNIHILTGDAFEKVVAWYSQKLGKFDIDRQKKGTQALWSKETDDGFFITVTISNMSAPAGKVEITMNKMKVK